MEVTKTYLKDLIYKVNGAAIDIHKALGPGLSTSVYQKCLIHELTEQSIPHVADAERSITYKNLELSETLHCHLLVEEILPIIITAEDSILPTDETHMNVCLKFFDVPIGLIYNFNVIRFFKEGQKTITHELYTHLPK